MNPEPIRKIQEILNRISKVLTTPTILSFPFLTQQMQVQKIIASIVEKIAKLKERLDKIEKCDFEYKWLQSITFSFGNKLMGLYERGGNKEANKFLIGLFRDKENVASFKEWLKGQSAYEERKQIIDDCLQAHLEKKFTLAIPVLLAQCDGIIINTVVKRGKYTGKSADFVNMKKVAKDDKISMNQHFSRHIINIYDTKRLKILHGRDTDYYKDGEELSVKIIWTLFEIIHFASEIK